MRYKRMPIEIEAPEGFGYDKIDCNLSESSFADQKLSDLGIDLSNVFLFYGDHRGKIGLRELTAITSDASPNAGKSTIYTSGCPRNQNKCWNNIGLPPR